MPLGSHHRLEGLLLRSMRGLLLHIDDGGVWTIDHDSRAAKFVGRRVIVEGTHSGFDRMDADWIGQAHQNGPSKHSA